MNAFLEETRVAYQRIIENPKAYCNLRVVLSNESCDLDSAIGALVYGFILHHEGIQENRPKTAVLPLLNIPQDDLPLKTEVTYFLKANGIALENVPTRGIRNLLDLGKVHEAGFLELTLVDHHNMCSADEQLQSAVVEVVDHRPQDPRWLWKELKNLTIENVGSCCTLLANKIKERSPHLMTQEIAKLLLGPILLDTVNLSPEAGKATALDEQMVSYLESVVTVDKQYEFNMLIQAKADIQSLLTNQVLRKDMKIIAGVPICGIPVLISEFMNRTDFIDSLNEFRRVKNNIPVVILMGVNIAGETVQRDVAVYGETKTADAIIHTLLSNTEPNLELSELNDHGIPSFRIFKQGNLRATRKQIGPVVAKVSGTLEEIGRCGLE